MSARRPLVSRALILGGALAAAGAAACAPLAGPAEIEAQNPPRGRFVEARGLQVHYVESGPADAQPVVLVHGATGNLNDMTFDLAPRLADRYRVVAFDRPGLGYTQRPAEDGWRPAVQAAILREAAAALDIRNPILLGHSWGGALVMAWALQAPQDVAGVVVVSGATMPYGDGSGLLAAIKTSRPAARVSVAAYKAIYGEDGGASAAARIFAPQPVPGGYLDHLQAELLLRPESFQANAEDIEYLDDALAEQARRYPDLPVPIEILHGTADRTVAASIHAEGLTKAAPNTNLTLFDGVGHMLHHARPEAVVEAVERLASRTEAPE